MPRQRTLARAEHLLRRRHFSDVVALLEPQVFMYRENPEFYRLLGTACLYSGEFAGAYSYLSRSEQLRAGDARVRLGLAVVYLRRRNVRQALETWLSILDANPTNKAAKRGLSLARQTEDPAEYVAMAESGQLKRLYPPLGFVVPRWIPALVLVAAVVTAGIAYGPALWKSVMASRATPRVGIEELSLQEETELLAEDGVGFRYQLDEESVADLIRTIGDYFNDYRDNLARREVNRILNSNAGLMVKERVRLIAAYFREPSFDEFRDNFSYAEVVAEPWLYRGCYVRWSGSVSNLVVNEQSIDFLLLVGYQEGRVLEGTVPVRIPFSADVSGAAVELIGRVEQQGNGIVLEAVSIRRIVGDMP